jgi:outer membrane protein
MRFKAFVMVAILWGVGASAAARGEDAASGKVLTFDLSAAKAIAVARNFGVSAARHSVEAARERFARARSLFLPRLGLAGGGEANGVGDQGQAASVGYVYGQLNMFNGGRDLAALRVAEVEVARAESEARVVEFQVALDVERSFHQYIYKRDLLALKKKALELNASHQNYLARGRRTGLASRTDEMDFKIKEALLKSEIVSLEQEREDARSELKRLFGEEVGGAIEPLGELRLQRVKGTLGDYLARIDRSAESIKQAALEREVARLRQTSARGRWLPEINFEGRAGFLPLADRGASDKPAASVSVIAKMELFSGFDATREAWERAAEASSSDARLKDEIVSAVRAVEVGYRNLKSIERRVDLEKGNVEWSREFYRSVLDEYIRGYKNSSDLRAAADRLYDAETQEKSFQYEFLKARLEVERVLGSALEVETLGTGTSASEALKSGAA